MKTKHEAKKDERSIGDIALAAFKGSDAKKPTKVGNRAMRRRKSTWRTGQAKMPNSRTRVSHATYDHFSRNRGEHKAAKERQQERAHARAVKRRKEAAMIARKAAAKEKGVRGIFSV